MKLIAFALLFVLPLYTIEASTDLAVLFQHVGCHPSAQTLGSSKIDHKQAHYATFSMKLSKNWIPVSSTGMTPSATHITYKSQCLYSCVSATFMTESNLTHFPVLFQHGIRKKKDMDQGSQATLMTGNNAESLTHNKKLLFISSDVKPSFFATGVEQGLAPNTVMKLIDVYKDFGVDFKKDIVLTSKLEVLFERLDLLRSGTY